MFWNKKKPVEPEVVKVKSVTPAEKSEAIKLVEPVVVIQESPQKKATEPTELIIDKYTKKTRTPYYLLKVEGIPEFSFHFFSKEAGKRVYDSFLEHLKQGLDTIQYSHTGPETGIYYPHYRGDFEIIENKSEFNECCIFRNKINSISFNQHSFLKRGIITIKVNYTEEYFLGKMKEHNVEIRELAESSTSKPNMKSFCESIKASCLDLMYISYGMTDKDNYNLVWGQKLEKKIWDSSFLD